MTMIIDKINDKDWDDFVLSHPFGNIYQTSSMYEVYRNTKNYDPIKLFAIDEITNEIKGVLSAVVIREKEGILGHFSIHSIIQGGPLISANSSGVLSEILVEYDKLASKKSPFSEIKNLSDQSYLFKNLKSYIYKDHLNFLIDLNQSEKELWKQIQKPRRKNINRAINDGIVIEEINDKKMIPIFYSLLQETYKNAKIPLSDITLFESAFDYLIPKNLVKFFLAKYNDKYIGARAILTYKNCIYPTFRTSF